MRPLELLFVRFLAVCLSVMGCDVEGDNWMRRKGDTGWLLRAAMTGARIGTFGQAHWMSRLSDSLLGEVYVSISSC